MAQDKLNESDDGFLEVPEGALMIASGVNGAETWIERDVTATVRIMVATVGVASTSGATLEAVIETDGGVAKAQDGPGSPDDHHQHLQAEVSVQVVARAGERVKFRAYPNPQGVRVLRTVVYAEDVKPPSFA